MAWQWNGMVNTRVRRQGETGAWLIKICKGRGGRFLHWNDSWRPGPWLILRTYMQHESGEGKGSQTVFKCHGSLENSPSSSPLLPFPSNHGRAPHVGRQPPLGIENFLSHFFVFKSVRPQVCRSVVFTLSFRNEKEGKNFCLNHSVVPSLCFGLLLE